MTNPLVTVLLPVYNGEKYLDDAIKSILNQSYTHFEFIIINDGSTDGSEKIIKSYRDPRIKYIKNEKNFGLSHTLNKGLKLSLGTYIARMDADDMSYPSRLEKQVHFLNNHPDYGIVGSMYIIMNEDRKSSEIGGLNFRNDEEIKLSLFSDNIFRHGETMFRKELIDKYCLAYDSAYYPCEDYHLWVRMSDLTKFHILEEALYSYMINRSGISVTKKSEQERIKKYIESQLQLKKGLPDIPMAKIFEFYQNGRKKADGQVYFENHLVRTKQQLVYQEFLFRTGITFLKNRKKKGFAFLCASFMINPSNWLGKPLRSLSYKQ